MAFGARLAGRLSRLCTALTVALALPTALVAQQTTGTLAGTITDDAGGTPLAGAQVFLPATRQGAIADEQGHYSIANIKPGQIQVRIRMLGYAQLERTVTITAGQTSTLDAALNRTAVVLDATVVTATGEERTKQIGNAISTIDSSSIARAPVSDAQDILAGRSPGVTVLQNSGQPGAGGVIRLRGVNSVSQGNEPIIYVDGVRIYNGATPTSVGGRQGTLPLNDIDPADIARIEVVKGPAATTLYGTEASGGVIQIFTKRGSSSKPVWHAEASGGFNNIGHIGPDGDPTGMFLNECRGANLVAGDGTRFEDPTCPESGSWLSNGAVQRYSLSVRGGSDNTSYYASGNYANEKGVLPTGGNKDGGFRGNFSFRPTEGLELALSSSYTRRDVDWVPDGNNGSGVLLNVSRGPFGNFQGSGCTDEEVVCLNNADIFTSSNSTKSDHYITGLTITYAPGEKLSNRLAVGYDYNNAIITDLNPFGFPRVPLGSLDRRNWSQKLITVDYAGSVNLPFGDSFVSKSSWGGQLFDKRHTFSSYSADNFSGPGLPTLTSGALRNIGSDDNDRVINAGFFLQEMIGWKDRLFLTGGLRVDGNSAFGSGFGLQPYPKVSASYVISDESFWPSSVIETMKLRGAIGESGKAPGAFDARRTWAAIAANDGQPAVTPEHIGNPDLGPERTREYELGFDASALEGRIGVGFTFYKQHTFDALIPVLPVASNGFTSSQLENVGELNNRGVELSVDAALIRRENLDWHARLNFTTIKSEAGDIGGQTLTIAALQRMYVKEGLPVPAYIGKKITNPNEFADPVIEEDAYIGSAFPTKIISPSTSITFLKRFTFDALGEFQIGGHLLNATGYQNAYKGVWQPCIATQAKMEAFASGDNPNALDDVTALERARCTLKSSVRDYDWWIESTDFFKLRSVSLTYDVPDDIVPGLRNASVTLAGKNLFVSTDYTGTDPEVTDVRDNSFGRRDYYNFPSYRTFLASIRVTF